MKHEMHVLGIDIAKRVFHAVSVTRLIKQPLLTHKSATTHLRKRP